MFNHAIVRKPGKNFCDGITKVNLGCPDYEKATQQHITYCNTLKQCGLDIISLEPDSRFPDGVFVEDTAVVADDIAVITNLGHPKRHGEEDKIKETLAKYLSIEQIKPPGTLDGGDVLRINEHFYIGISGRTNSEGARQLSAILAKYGYSSDTIPVGEVLHLKTGVTYIGSNTLVGTKEFKDLDEFSQFRMITVDDGERYAANCLLVNNTLIIAKGFPEVLKKLSRLDYRILEMDMSEFQKMDGELTCLSILF